MFNFGFILFILGALGYISGLWKKPWPRETVIILFVIYLAVSCLKCRSDSDTGNNINDTKDNSSETSGNASNTDRIPLVTDNTGNFLVAGNPPSYTDEINQAKVNIQKGDFQKALDNLDQAAASDTGKTNIGFIKVFRIQVLIDMQDFKKALGELLQMNEADLGANEKAWYFRYFKTCYQALGDVKKANEYDEKLKDFQYPVADIGQRTKDSACKVQGQLQDKACTPGFVLTENTNQICSNSYLKTNADLSGKDKDRVFQEYGISHYKSRDYKIDYLIPIELGGTSNIANLWPEPVEPKPGYYEKQMAAKHLHDEVCAGRMTLSRAQEVIANNWLDVYKGMK